MNHKSLTEPSIHPAGDPLSMYHHLTAFETQLWELLSVLELPKDRRLPDRFKKIDSLLNKSFSLELIHYLGLKNSVSQSSEDESAHSDVHSELLLHLWCLLECSDSPDYIAGYLGLSVEEVKELIRELHHTFNIDRLVSRIWGYYKQNKRLREASELHKEQELLGFEPSHEPQDTAEDRKQRLRRRYGYLGQPLVYP